MVATAGEDSSGIEARIIIIMYSDGQKGGGVFACCFHLAMICKLLDSVVMNIQISVTDKNDHITTTLRGTHVCMYVIVFFSPWSIQNLYQTVKELAQQCTCIIYYAT